MTGVAWQLWSSLPVASYWFTGDGARRSKVRVYKGEELSKVSAMFSSAYSLVQFSLASTSTCA